MVHFPRTLRLYDVGSSMKRPVLLHLAILAGLWILILPGTAWAYIDPGTGSYLFQLVIAGGLAALYTLRRYWQNVKTMLASVLGRKRESTADPSDGVD